jgi:hypothetical protein
VSTPLQKKTQSRGRGKGRGKGRGSGKPADDSNDDDKNDGRDEGTDAANKGKGSGDHQPEAWHKCNNWLFSDKWIWYLGTCTSLSGVNKTISSSKHTKYKPYPR